MSRTLIHIRAIREWNAENGQHWFEPATLRFFNSRVGANVYPCSPRQETYFVSSEQRDGTCPRLFTVRAASWANGHIRTVGKFQQYTNRKTAENAARAYSHNCSEPREEA